MAYPKVLISIIAYKSKPFIEDCLNSLRKINYPKEAYKIMLSDNNCTDGSVEIVRDKYPEVEIIYNKKNLGFSGGNNILMNKAISLGYDYVVLLNDDTIVTPDWLLELVKVAESYSRIGAVQSKILLHPEQDKINTCGNIVHYLGFGYTSEYRKKVSEVVCLDKKEIACASGCSVLYRVNLLREIGVLDDLMFAYHEDTDLSWRIRLFGYKIAFSANSILYHKYEFSRSKKKFYFIERNRWLLLFYNYKIKTLLLILPIFLGVEFGLFAISVINGWWFEKIKAWLFFLNPYVWYKIWQKRKFINQIRQLSDAEITRLFIDEISFQEVDTFLVRKVANPILKKYWSLIKRFI